MAAEGPRGRKEYAITEAGGSELRHWLTEVEPIRTRRSDSLLRVFFLGELTRVEAKAYLLREAERRPAQLAGRRRRRRSSTGART